jgi:uncharacterized protein YfaP (DUF2135 family)
VNNVRHIVRLPGPAGEIRENITLVEGPNRIAVQIGEAAHAVRLDLPRSEAIQIESPDVGARVGSRACEFTGAFEGTSCPAGVVCVNGFMHQFMVTGTRGRFGETVVLRPGANHLAVQIGEYYATRIITGTFGPSKMLVTLVWDNDRADLDLYVINPAGAAVWYNNQRLPSGAALDVDHRGGFGPENFSFGRAGAEVPPGRYRVRVHLFSDHGDVSRTEWAARVITDENTSEQQLKTYWGILDVSNSANDRPFAAGPDWNDVCEITVNRTGRISLAP